MWFFFRKFKNAQKLDVGQSFVIFLYRDMRANQKEVWGGQKKQKKFKYKVKKRILRDSVMDICNLQEIVREVRLRNLDNLKTGQICNHKENVEKSKESVR